MKIRIVEDNYSGYEFQVWRWYFPFWINVYYNTAKSPKIAEEMANDYVKMRGKTKVIKQWEVK